MVARPGCSGPLRGTWQVSDGSRSVHAQQYELVFCRACLGKPGWTVQHATGRPRWNLRAEVADLRQPVL